MQLRPIKLGGGVWFPWAWLAITWTLRALRYIVPLFLMLAGCCGFGKMENIFEFIGNIELIVAGALAVLVAFFLIKLLLANAYAATANKKIKEQYDLVKEGKQADNHVIEQYGTYNKDVYRLPMYMAVVVSAALAIVTVIGVASVFPKLGLIYTAPVAAVVLSAFYAIACEKLCAASATGTLKSQYTDKYLEVCLKSLKPANEEVKEEVKPEFTQEQAAFLADLFGKFGKKLD